MSPCQQAIQVPDLHIEFVVSLWSDCNYAVGTNCPDVRRLSRTRPSDIFVLSRTCMRASSLYVVASTKTAAMTRNQNSLPCRIHRCRCVRWGCAASCPSRKNGSSRLRNYCGTGSLKACPSKTTRRAAQGMLKNDAQQGRREQRSEVRTSMTDVLVSC